MNIYSKNKKFIKLNAPDLYKTLTAETPLQNIHIEKMPDQNNYIMESNEAKCFMHSIYNMENEIKMMLSSVENNVDTLILFGLGNGYALEHIINKYKNLYEIVVIEPSLEIFKEYLKNWDLAKMLKVKKNLSISFLVNKSEDFIVEILFSKMAQAKNPSMAFHVSYCCVFNTYYNNMTTKLFKYLKVRRTDISTFSVSWRLWLFNTIKNLKTERTIPVECIIDSLKGKTAVIVSAGPSLNKNIHMLEKLKEKALIFAVGSAIKILESRGIIPHFRVAIDGWPAEQKLFKNINTQTSALLFSESLYYEILPEYKGPKIRMALESGQATKYIYKKAGIDYQEFLSGASVANATVNFLCDIGLKRIVFMGQDLSYTEEGLHAKGLGEETEKRDQEHLAKKRYTVVENIYGEKVYTTDVFLSMKYSIEDTVKRHPNIEFINATEGGLGIDGSVNLTAQEVFESILEGAPFIHIQEEIDARIKDEKLQKEYHEKINKALDIMKEELNDIKIVLNDMMKFLNKLNKLKQKNASIRKMESEIRYLETLQKRMEEIPLYKEVIINDLSSDFLSIKTTFGYKGSDREKAVESKEKILLNTAVIVKEYVDLACGILDGKYKNMAIE